MLRPPRVPAPPGRLALEASATVRAAVLVVLTPEERTVVCKRFGLEGEHEHAEVEAIADELQVPTYVVLRRLRSAAAKLRDTGAVRDAWERLQGAASS